MYNIYTYIWLSIHIPYIYILYTHIVNIYTYTYIVYKYIYIYITSYRGYIPTSVKSVALIVRQELDTLGMERKLGELTPTEEFVAMLRVAGSKTLWEQGKNQGKCGKHGVNGAKTQRDHDTS